MIARKPCKASSGILVDAKHADVEEATGLSGRYTQAAIHLRLNSQTVEGISGVHRLRQAHEARYLDDEFESRGYWRRCDRLRPCDGPAIRQALFSLRSGARSNSFCTVVLFVVLSDLRRCLYARVLQSPTIAHFMGDREI